MAITTVQEKTKVYTATDATSCTISFTSTCTANNLLIAGINIRRGDTGTISVTSGWTILSAGRGTGVADVSAAWAYKISDGSETSVTFSWGNPYEYCAGFIEFSGNATSSVLDGSVAENESYVASGWPGGSVTAGSLTPTVANGIDIAIGCGISGASWSSFTWSSGYTNEVDVNDNIYNPRLSLAYKTYSTTDALDPGVTISNTAVGYIAHALFKEPTASKNVSHLLCLGAG